MTALIPLLELFGLKNTNPSKYESTLLEVQLYLTILDEITNHYIEVYKKYFQLIKIKKQQEREMVENNLAKLFLHDIVESEEYTLQGVALYANTHIDALLEILSGMNDSPSHVIFRKILELHILVRKHLYSNVINKLLSINKELPMILHPISTSD